MLALQQNGYLQQLTGWQFDRLLFSQTGIVLVMSLNIFPVIYFAVSRRCRFRVIFLHNRLNALDLMGEQTHRRRDE